MTYTQADADAARSKIAADNATLATQTQAVTDALTTLASAQAAETTAGTQLTAAQDALASAQSAATDAASKLDAASAAVSATKADIATEQAIIDAFNAQPAPPPPPPTSWAPPIVEPAPPVLNNPFVITQQQRLKDGQSYHFANRTLNPKAIVKCPYAVKDGGHLGTVIIEDHDLTGGCGIIRLDNGIVDELIVRRCILPQGHYDPGVICGLVLVGHTYVKKITIEDCVYDRVEFITSSGDIYAGVLTGGGHGHTGVPYGQCDSFVMRNIKASNCWTAYPASDTSYPNSDGSVAEVLFQNGLVQNCEFRHGADAGFDRKCPKTVFDHVLFDDWRESDKLWCPADDIAIFSYNPRHAHVVVTPQPQWGRIPYHCQHRTFASSNPKTPLFDIQRAGWNAVYDHVDLSQLPSGQVLAIAETSAFGSTVNLGGKLYTINHGTVML